MSDDFDGSSIGDLSDVGDGAEGELLSFTPVLKMPSGRLQVRFVLSVLSVCLFIHTSVYIRL